MKEKDQKVELGVKMIQKELGRDLIYIEAKKSLSIFKINKN